MLRQIHAIKGDQFGYVQSAGYSSWHQALQTQMSLIASDLETYDRQNQHARKVLHHLASEPAIFDPITPPRLLHDDLWTGNIVIDPVSDQPQITGIVDHDRVFWGDPEAVWTIFMANSRPGTTQDAPWGTYDALSSQPDAKRRRLYCQALHLLASRFEIYRLNLAEKLTASHWDVTEVLKNCRFRFLNPDSSLMELFLGGGITVKYFPNSLLMKDNSHFFIIFFRSRLLFAAKMAT